MFTHRRRQPRSLSNQVVAKADDVLSHIDAEERAAYVERVNAGA